MKTSFIAETESIPEIVNLVSTSLEAKGFNKKLIMEYGLLVEEIAIKLIESAKENSELVINMKRKYNSYEIVIGCPGKIAFLGHKDEFDYGGMIIKEYNDYLRQSYSEGNNYVTLSFSTSSNQTFFASIIALVLSCIVALPMLFFCTPEQINWMDVNIVRPIVSFFVRCLQTLSMPATFFSLACLIVNVKLYLSDEIRLNKYFIKCFVTSFYAVGVGILLWVIYDKFGFIEQIEGCITKSSAMFGKSVEGFLMKLISCNFIEPFALDNPIPLLILAVVLGFAIGNVFGEKGDFARKSIRSLKAVFGSMLNIIYGMVPFFLFFAFQAGWIHYGYGFILHFIKIIVMFLPAFILLFAFYMILLMKSGINPIKFIIEYKELIWNNLKIGSNIEARPYNKRVLFRKTKINRSLLHKELKLGCMINMDGNCIMLSLGIFILISAVGIQIMPHQIIAISLIILLLGVGIPNQPGSFLLGMILLMTYVGISDQLYFNVLIIEAFLNKIYSFANSIGDVVAVLTNEENKKEEKSSPAV